MMAGKAGKNEDKAADRKTVEDAKEKIKEVGKRGGKK